SIALLQPVQISPQIVKLRESVPRDLGSAAPAPLPSGKARWLPKGTIAPVPSNLGGREGTAYAAPNLSCHFVFVCLAAFHLGRIVALCRRGLIKSPDLHRLREPLAGETARHINGKVRLLLDGRAIIGAGVARFLTQKGN